MRPERVSPSAESQTVHTVSTLTALTELYHGDRRLTSAGEAFRRRRELFVIYAYVYGLIAVDIVVVADFLHDEIVVAAYVMLSTVAVIVALFVTHMRLRRAEA